MKISKKLFYHFQDFLLINWFSNLVPFCDMKFLQGMCSYSFIFCLLPFWVLCLCLTLLSLFPVICWHSCKTIYFHPVCTQDEIHSYYGYSRVIIFTAVQFPLSKYFISYTFSLWMDLWIASCCMPIQTVPP